MMSPRTGSAPAAASSRGRRVRARQRAHRPAGGHEPRQDRAPHEPARPGDEDLSVGHVGNRSHPAAPRRRRQWSAATRRRTAPASLSARASAASARQSSRESSRTRCLTSAIRGGGHAQLVHARGPPAAAPATGSAAASPQTATRHPRAPAASATAPDRAAAPRDGPDPTGGPRPRCPARRPSCTAPGRWSRSTGSRPRRRARRPAAPPPGPPPSSPPRPPRRPGRRPPATPRASSSRARAARSSPISLTIGNITPIGPALAARSAARSWVRRISGRARHRRRPRTPRNGLSSAGQGQVGQGLVGAGVERAQHQAAAARARRPPRA